MAMAVNTATLSVSNSSTLQKTLSPPTWPNSRGSLFCSTSSRLVPSHCCLISSATLSREGASRAAPSSSTFSSSVGAPANRLPSSRFASREVMMVWRLAASSARGSGAVEKEEVFFDGGPHYGDLVTNLVFGLTVVWLPLTLASVFRSLFLRYRFTNLRVTILSGLTGEDRKDFTYEVIKDVKFVPRFIGEWGDMVITLTDGTQVEVRCIPKFREIAKYCLDKAGQKQAPSIGSNIASPAAGPKGF